MKPNLTGLNINKLTKTWTLVQTFRCKNVTYPSSEAFNPACSSTWKKWTWMWLHKDFWLSVRFCFTWGSKRNCVCVVDWRVHNTNRQSFLTYEEKPSIVIMFWNRQTKWIIEKGDFTSFILELLCKMSVNLNIIQGCHQAKYVALLS